ncbi:hypothetical protein ABZ419_29705 [Streptomyces cinnamoneus]|uniref:hypothetical protein n=1 Tax=Streptomyces cinnamoneus TaxID=53446 RepID=UPI0033F1417C
MGPPAGPLRTDPHHRLTTVRSAAGAASGRPGRRHQPPAQPVRLRRLQPGADAVAARTGVRPDGLVHFEAHGTGTAAGDPAEADAVGRALAHLIHERHPANRPADAPA